MRGVAADFLSVEHMDLAKPRDGFLAETSRWDVNQLPAMLSGEPSPGGSGSRMAEHGDVAFPAVMTSCGQQSFLERIGQSNLGSAQTSGTGRGGNRNMAPS